MNKKIRIFMLGWEFPPVISGGLGTACYGLTKAMDRLGMHLVFVLPKTNPMRFGSSKTASGRSSEASSSHGFKHVEFRTIASSLRPYVGVEHAVHGISSEQISQMTLMQKAKNPLAGFPDIVNYNENLYSAVHHYANDAVNLALREDFDVIHAHDWMTYPASMAIAEITGKPLVVQIHSTEFDRSGEHVNQMVYDIERQGMQAADKVIAVSHYTRNLVIHRYAIDPEKIEVVYNGVDFDKPAQVPAQTLPAKGDKIVLFLGRITMQKGPEYFLHAAKRVLEKLDNVKFIMAGAGDMLYRSVEMAAGLGIGHKVLFTRFLRGADVDKAYRLADLYVMPSVSEPFGIAPLEAMRQNVPVLISKQSGVSEVLKNALKVDFWDINQMADKMIAVLKHPPLQKTLRENGAREIHKFRWEDSAARMQDIYKTVVTNRNTATYRR